MVSSRELRLSVGEGSPLLTTHPFQVGNSSSQEQAGHHRPVCTGALPHPCGAPFSGWGALADGVMTWHPGSCSPIGRSSGPHAGRGRAGCGGRDLASPLIRTPCAWPGARARGITYLLLLRGRLLGGTDQTWTQPRRLLAMGKIVVNNNKNLRFLGAFHLRISKH